MLAQYLDVAPQINASGTFSYVIDVSNYDYCLIQPIGVSVTISSTIDGGAVQGVTDGNSNLATNFVATKALNVNDNATLTSTLSSTNTYRLGVVGRYVKITSGATINKCLVMLAKIS